MLYKERKMSEIYERLSTAVLEGDAEKAHKLVERGLKQGLSPKEILDNGLIVGMDEVGARFKRGDMFVPEVLMSADSMAAGMEILRPLLIESGAEMLGKILMGTVKGDLHDIGKNLVSMLCEGAGFEIIDIGFNAEPEKFIEGIKEHQPQVVGMSAMLTTTMRAMGQTIKAIEEAGLRDKVKIMVGGAPVDKDFADTIGADGYGSNAPSGADLAKQLVGAA
jgi:5-methyltetrahydrofolate--homocysteine methyltransferase